MEHPIASIVIEERRREDLGDVAGLAESIARYGLLHPIVLDATGRLVAGERRLRACEQLGWTDIPVRYLGELTEQERREIELEENLRRKDLTAHERSKIMAERAAVAEEIVQHAPLGEAEVLLEASKTSSGGRPPAGSVPETEVAQYLGVSRQTLRNAKAHVAAVEQYPELAPLPQAPALEAAAALDALPDDVARADARARLRAQAQAERQARHALLTEAGLYDAPRAQRNNHACHAAVVTLPILPDAMLRVSYLVGQRRLPPIDRRRRPGAGRCALG